MEITVEYNKDNMTMQLIQMLLKKVNASVRKCMNRLFKDRWESL